MQNDFTPQKMKKAKWALIKNYEISKERIEEMKPSPIRRKKGFRDFLKKRFGFNFIRLWW
jgi:hypothetical protein